MQNNQKSIDILLTFSEPTTKQDNMTLEVVKPRKNQSFVIKTSTSFKVEKEFEHGINENE